MLGLMKKNKGKGPIQEKVDSKSLGELRMKKDIEELKNLRETCPQCQILKISNNNMDIDLEISPDKETYWSGGKYKFHIHIPDDYPNAQPECKCETPIYHPNIDLQGNICLNIISKDKKGWIATLDISRLIVGLVYLFQDPNPQDPINHECAKEMRENMESFKTNVKKTLQGYTMFGVSFPKFIPGKSNYY